MLGSVGGRELWHHKFAGEKLDGVRYAISLGLGHVDAITSIVLQGRASVPPSVVVGVPGLPFVWFDMDDNFGARWCEWGSIKIKVAMQLGIDGQLWVQARGTKEVESKVCLLNECVPQEEGDKQIC